MGTSTGAAAEDAEAAEMPVWMRECRPWLRFMLVTLNGDSVEKLVEAESAACTLPAAVRPASTRTMRVGVVENTW